MFKVGESMFELIVGLEEICMQKKIVVAGFQQENLKSFERQMSELELLQRCQFCSDGKETYLAVVECFNQAIVQAPLNAKVVKPIDLLILHL